LHPVGILFPHINEDAGQNHIKYCFVSVAIVLKDRLKINFFFFS